MAYLAPLRVPVNGFTATASYDVESGNDALVTATWDYNRATGIRYIAMRYVTRQLSNSCSSTAAFRHMMWFPAASAKKVGDGLESQPLRCNGAQARKQLVRAALAWSKDAHSRPAMRERS
jgi:hypothetical protein